MLTVVIILEIRGWQIKIIRLMKLEIADIQILDRLELKIDKLEMY